MPIPDTVHHVGVLTADLDAAREKWAAATGYTFSPVTRYRCVAYRDLNNPEPHLHDARISFSFEGRPFIELMGQTGEGTHSAKHGEGGHHLGFPVIPDNVVRAAELADLGIAIDGENIQDGRSILMFTERPALNNVHAEYVEDGHDHPDVKDDGSPVNRLPNGEKTLFEPETVERLTGAEPGGPLITEIGIVVADLGAAVARWGEVTGYTFAAAADAAASGAAASGAGELAVISDQGLPRIRLVQNDSDQSAEGLRFLILDHAADLEDRLAALEAAGVRVAKAVRDEQGVLTALWTDPADLNGIQLRYSS